MEKGKTVLILTALLFVMFCSPLYIAYAESDPQIHAPRVFPNDALSTGLETIWSCIYFGHYPAAEVVKSGWDSVDKYAVRDGDLIRDDDLYLRLREADWSGDRLSMDGQNYIRINHNGAMTAAEDREQHYRWDTSDEWHYFIEEPIKWRILSLKDGKALLLSDRILDCFPFNLNDEEVNWQTSSIRSWLNGYDSSHNLDGVNYSGKGFLNKAFTPEEQKAIGSKYCIRQIRFHYP